MGMVTRSALPQNYELSPGTLVDSLDSLTGWTKSANGTMELDTTHFSEGSASIIRAIDRFRWAGARYDRHNFLRQLFRS